MYDSAVSCSHRDTRRLFSYVSVNEKSVTFAVRSVNTSCGRSKVIIALSSLIAAYGRCDLPLSFCTSIPSLLLEWGLGM